jgi:hypothetical protein
LSKGNPQFKVMLLFWANFSESHEEVKENKKSGAKAAHEKAVAKVSRKAIFGW